MCVLLDLVGKLWNTCLSDLANQTGIEKKKNKKKKKTDRPFDHPQAELDILSFQKTYKWAMETRGPKSNLAELLCLSSLPATLMMIRSKTNELHIAWIHHFPIISLLEKF